MVVVGWKLMNLDLELILNHQDIWLSFDIFHFRWHWSTRTCGRSSTSTGPRWSSPSQAGEFNFLLLATCAILPNLQNHATHGSAYHPCTKTRHLHLHPHSQRLPPGHHHYPQWSCIGVWANKTRHQNRIIFAGIYINAGKNVNQADQSPGVK